MSYNKCKNCKENNCNKNKCECKEKTNNCYVEPCKGCVEYIDTECLTYNGETLCCEDPEFKIKKGEPLNKTIKTLAAVVCSNLEQNIHSKKYVEIPEDLNLNNGIIVYDKETGTFKLKQIKDLITKDFLCELLKNIDNSCLPI